MDGLSGDSSWAVWMALKPRRDMAQSVALDGGSGSARPRTRFASACGFAISFFCSSWKGSLRFWAAGAVYYRFMSTSVLRRPCCLRFTGPSASRSGRGKLSAIVAALPLVMAYVACDVYFVAYGDVLRIIDLRNLPELLKVLHFEGRRGCCSPSRLPAVLLLAFVDYRRYWRALTVAGLLLLGAAAVEFFPNAVVSGLQSWRDWKRWIFSDAECLDDNGRLTVALYFEAARKVAITQTDRVPQARRV